MQNDLKNSWPAFNMYSQAARQSKVCVGNTNHEFNLHLWMWPSSLWHGSKTAKDKPALIQTKTFRA